jgi:pyruvate dehydrogenase E2 component (dihydrolipoamide acetyltransferase)
MAIEKILIPDFGDVQEITVVEVFISPGDAIEEEASLIALESEKAVMDIPSTYSGVIQEVLVSEEDVVSSGDVIATIEVASDAQESGEATADNEIVEDSVRLEDEKPEVVNHQKAGEVYHATPSVRAFARQQGVELSRVIGTGPKGRILKEDIQVVIASPSSKVAGVPASSSALQSQSSSDGAGTVEEVPLGRIQKISGPHLLKSWVGIPHVTHFDEADLTSLESFRKELNKNRLEGQPTYSPLAFVVRAAAGALGQHPLFNCSLDSEGEKIILKKYYNIGIAVDTPNGLVVPVIKDAEKKGLLDISMELARLSTDARAGKLAIQDLQGATFTISSLGGIGGTGFTPIISSPQAAILGLSRNFMKPVWDGEQFRPQLTLPFSVSYDHRVIDGAEAARFCRTLRLNIEDLKRTLI